MPRTQPGTRGNIASNISCQHISERSWKSAEVRRLRVRRQYEFIRKADGKLIARGETDWVYAEAKTGRTLAIPAEAQALFPVRSITESEKDVLDTYD